MSALVLGSALLMGLLGGMHCLAMCGGVVGVLCSGLPEPVRARPIGQLPFALAYNAGRVLAYGAGGLAAGHLGALVTRATALGQFQTGLRLFAGLLMVGLGLYLAGVWAGFARLEWVGLPLWRALEPMAKSIRQLQSLHSAVALGFVWGWLPCGLVYSALALAVASGSGAAGAATMLAFGLGTAPTMIAAGAIASWLARFVRGGFVRRAAGLTIVIFGLLNLAAVSARAGWIPSTTPGAHACCATKR